MVEGTGLDPVLRTLPVRPPKGRKKAGARYAKPRFRMKKRRVPRTRRDVVRVARLELTAS